MHLLLIRKRVANNCSLLVGTFPASSYHDVAFQLMPIYFLGAALSMAPSWVIAPRESGKSQDSTIFPAAMLNI